MASFFLKKIEIGVWCNQGCARRGASGALHPKSAYAGLNSCPRVLDGTLNHPTGRYATDGHEPRQVRKEAAISDAGCVVVFPVTDGLASLEKIRRQVHNLFSFQS
jgi:hypothetical protein